MFMLMTGGSLLIIFRVQFNGRNYRFLWEKLLVSMGKTISF